MGNIPKILVAGCGSWGKNLARNLHELGVLHSLCDSSKERLSEISSKYPGVHAFSSVEEALKTGGFSAVVVATPAATHYPLGKLFLEAGYDVFIEKPLALTARQGEELLQIAERNSKIIFVGHILLYHPAVSALKSLVSGGELGKVQYIYSNRLNLGKVRKEENILWSFAPHDIAIILHLLGEAPCSAAAFGGYYLNSNIADVTVTHLDFPSGVKAHIFVSWLHPYKDQRLIVIGDKKMAVFNDTAKDGKLSLYKHSFKWIDRLPVPEQGEREVIDIGDKEPLRLECMAFVESLETRVKPQTDGKEGLDVLKILAGCEESLQSNGKVVRFAPEPAPAPEAPKPGFFIHPSAFIDENVDIGDGTKIWHFCHVMKNTRIGQNCVLGQNVFLADSVIVGNKVKLENNVSVFKGVTLEDEVFVAPSATFTNVKNPRAFIERKSEYLPTLVKKGATIGANSTIVCGRTVGRYAFIGAGSVLTMNVRDFALVFGNPARQIGWMCRCGVRLELPVSSTHEIEADCRACKSGYVLKGESLFEKTKSNA